MILDNVIPIFAVIALGAFLRRFRLVDGEFLRHSDRLIYYIFFPILLFWKTGQPSPAGIEWQLIAAVLGAVFIIFVLSIVLAEIAGFPDQMVGSFSQSCYRFSTYVGMALVMTVAKEEGVRQFGVLIGFVIPFINILAVSSLLWYSGEHHNWRDQTTLLLKSLISNPLILACAAGMIYSQFGQPFPSFVENTLSLISLLALPLALISIGGSLTPAGLAGHLKLSTIAACFKFLLLPAVGYVLLKYFRVSDLGVRIGMIYFVLPTSPSNYILSRQLNSDVALAASALVLSTIVSMASLSVVVMLFR
jgi:malonate transporter and related proteins